MSPEFDEDRLCGDIPNAGRAVKRGRDDARAIGAEGRSTDDPFGLELADGLARFGVPDASGPVLRGSDDARAIRAECCGVNFSEMPLQLDEQLACLGIPNARRLVF